LKTFDRSSLEKICYEKATCKQQQQQQHYCHSCPEGKLLNVTRISWEASYRKEQRFLATTRKDVEIIWTAKR